MAKASNSDDKELLKALGEAEDFEIIEPTHDPKELN
jgi:hypothetical protein